MSLPALAMQLEAPVDSPATLQLEGVAVVAVDVTEVLPQHLSAAKTGTLAPINTPIGATGQYWNGCRCYRLANHWPS